MTFTKCEWCSSFLEPITRKMVRTPAGSTPPTTFTGPPDDYDDSKFVPVPIKKGEHPSYLSKLIC